MSIVNTSNLEINVRLSILMEASRLHNDEFQRMPHTRTQEIMLIVTQEAPERNGAGIIE